MARALALTAGVLAAVLGGCSPFGSGTFFCNSNDACNAGTDGRCENGFCSYADGSCSSGHRYSDHSGDKSNTCVGEAGGDDGGVDTPGGPACFGSTNGLVKPCFSSEPTGDKTLPATINTDSSPLCAATTSGGEGYCVIAGANLTVGEGTVAAIGSKPLVLVAVSTITITGTLDAASHHSGLPPQLTDPYTNAQTGAGAALASACGTGTAPGPGMGTGAGGGGAGATFGGKGGTGGDGADGTGGGNNGGAGGTANAPQPITTFRGGCPGQNGIKGTFGEGGIGGGAVYLIARTGINIMGAINASGEGGHPGVTGSAGGGGGGSGGMIGLDAPMITNSGTVFANGGSGGEGSGGATRGAAGLEATSAAPSADSGGLSNGGTGGGGGAGGTVPGGPGGRNGTTGAANVGGGGGGGGGTGVLKVFGATMIMGAGDHSPNPS